MAKNLSTLYPGKITVDANNLDGTFKNRISDALKDGTPYEKGWTSDVWGFLAHILKKALVTPSGAEENQTNSQYYDALDGLLGRRNVEFETSRDLVFNVISSTEAQATFSRMSLLDSNYVPKYLINQDITWDIEAAGVLEAGTSEKVSTDYGAWVDSDGVIKLVPDLESTADGTTAFKLVDSAATLLTDLVHAGDIVYNLTDLTQTTVSVDATLEGEVSLTDDIFVSGENYKIVKMSPLGLGANRERLATAINNAASNLANSYYTHIQEEKDYNGDGTDFDITSPPAGWSLVKARLTIKQVNDWTGQGHWEVGPNIKGTFTANTVVDITIGGIVFDSTAAFNQSYSLSSTSVSTVNKSHTLPGAGTLNGTYSANVSNASYKGSGLILNAKPTFHN